MEDKILIKSEIDKKTKGIMLGIVMALLGVSVILFLLLLIIEDTYYSGYTYYGVYFSSPSSRTALSAAFDGETGYLLMFIASCLFFVAGIIGIFFFWAHSKCSITVTENNVKGKTLFGKEVVLPMYMVSAYSTRKFLSTITVATSSGITKFALIKNYHEIGTVLSQMINTRQEKTVNQTNSTATPSNAMDDMVKLKNLLDQGVITQEEFEIKKKQILGL